MINDATRLNVEDGQQDFQVSFHYISGFPYSKSQALLLKPWSTEYGAPS